jgi:hypothetical protein
MTEQLNASPLLYLSSADAGWEGTGVHRTLVHPCEVKGTRNMALELYMLGLVVQDMGKSLEFYQRLGLAIPTGSEEKTHVEVKMGSGLTFSLGPQVCQEG